MPWWWEFQPRSSSGLLLVHDWGWRRQNHKHVITNMSKHTCFSLQDSTLRDQMRLTVNACVERYADQYRPMEHRISDLQISLNMWWNSTASCENMSVAKTWNMFKRYSIDFQNCIMQVILASENTNTFKKTHQTTTQVLSSTFVNLCVPKNTRLQFHFFPATKLNYL
jgi:hypothetical protein